MKPLLTLTALAVLCPIAHSATAPEVAAYSIPTDAQKRGPLPLKSSDKKKYGYFIPGDTSPISPYTFLPNGLIGYEIMIGDVLVERELFKEGYKHGIWREWYNNGQLKSEAPYKNGLMDGTFRNWNEKGQLMAQYDMVAGTGRRRLYYDNGRLAEEKNFKDNQSDGLVVALYDTGRINYIGRYEKDSTVGMWAYFYPSDKIRSVMWAEGTSINFKPNGSLQSTRWYTSKGNEVDEYSYSLAAAQNPNLPPYYKDAASYKKLVQSEFGALMQGYTSAPRVKIPLLTLDAPAHVFPR